VFLEAFEPGVFKVLALAIGLAYASSLVGDKPILVGL